MLLLQKSKFNQGDIISLKLITGEELLGKYVSEDMMEGGSMLPPRLAARGGDMDMSGMSMSGAMPMGGQQS